MELVLAQDEFDHAYNEDEAIELSQAIMGQGSWMKLNAARHDGVSYFEVRRRTDGKYSLSAHSPNTVRLEGDDPVRSCV